MLQRRLAQVGIAKQTAKGVYPATPLYGFGVISGRMIETDVQESEIAQTWSTRGVEGDDRTLVIPKIEFECVATPGVLGLCLFGALGADTVTGAGDPSSHALTPIDATLDLPYMCFFGRYGPDYTLLQD